MRRLPSPRLADLLGARLAAALFAAAGTCAAAESAADRFPSDPPVRLAPFEPVLPTGMRPLAAPRADLAGDSIRLAGGFETIPEIEPAPATKADSAKSEETAPTAAGPKLDATLLLDADESAGPVPYRCGRDAHAACQKTDAAVWKFDLAGIQIEWRLDGSGASATAAAIDDSRPEPSALGAASHCGGPCVAEGACTTAKPRWVATRPSAAEAQPSEAAQSVLDVMSQLGSVLDRSEMFADDAARCGAPARRERLLQVLHDLETETPLPEPSAIPGRHAADAEPLAPDDEPADPDQLWERALALRSAASELDHVADRLEAAAVYDQADELRAQGQRLRVEARGLVESCRVLARRTTLKSRSF